MGVLSAVLGAFTSKAQPITLDDTPAKGEALAAVTAMVAELRAAKPDEIRNPRARRFEAVIRRARLDANLQIFEGVFGEPCKPFGSRGMFTGTLAGWIEDMGGLMKSQCLFLRRFEDERVAYAALWPWEDADTITLKVGVFDDPLPVTSE